MPRFRIGDRVKILATVKTSFAGLKGVVDLVEPHNGNVTILDRYIVVFEWGEKQSFFDVQLVKIKASLFD
jgi:hypothetical protein